MKALDAGSGRTVALVQRIIAQRGCDALRQKRYKTVELAVDEVPWQPAAGVDPDQIVPLRIGFDEKDMQLRVKAAGGRWDAKGVVWRLRYAEVVELGIRDRIVKESGVRA